MYTISVEYPAKCLGEKYAGCTQARPRSVHVQNISSAIFPAVFTGWCAGDIPSPRQQPLEKRPNYKYYTVRSYYQRRLCGVEQELVGLSECVDE